MYIIYKKIFHEICNKDFGLYHEFIDTIKHEYITIKKSIIETTNCKELRYLVHRLISTLVILDNLFYEMKYICSLILSVDKNETDFSKYKPYIEMFSDCYSSGIYSFDVLYIP